MSRIMVCRVMASAVNVPLGHQYEPIKTGITRGFDNFCVFIVLFSKQVFFLNASKSKIDKNKFEMATRTYRTGDNLFPIQYFSS